MDSPTRRGELIRVLDQALALAEELEDGVTEYLIARALDEARARQFRPANERDRVISLPHLEGIVLAS
jgi:hypothetical protein